MLAERLPPALRSAVEEIERAAPPETVFLVGGVVRDLLLGRPVGDLDLLVAGDAPAFATRLAERLGGRVTVHREFGTATVETAGARIDLASARRERYPAPAALPEVEAGTLDDDLRRRDFTVNTLAVALGGAGGTEWIDRFGARADLEGGTLRVLHERSFLDDPTRILRGVRYELRLGFAWAPETEALARQAIEAGIFDRLSGERLRQELVRLLEEPEGPTAGLARLADLGVLGALHPGFRWTPEIGARLEQAAAALAELRAAARGPFHPRPWLVFVLALFHGRPAAVVERLALAGDERRIALRSAAAVERAREELAAADLPPHRAAAALRRLGDEELVLLGAAGGDVVRGWVRAEVERFRAFALTIGGDDLLRRGARPGPAVGRALAGTRDARLDGSIGAEEELSHALELLRRAGERIS